MLEMTEILLSWPDETIRKKDFLHQSGEETLSESINDLYTFKRLEERGYGDILLARYPSLRKYFAEFICLPFAIESGNENLMEAIEVVIRLDAGELKSIPDDALLICKLSRLLFSNYLRQPVMISALL